ncbi:transposase [Lederbergia galactosidilyticus]|nr:transposase [Lederbergia galactosidilytica]
MIAKTIGCSRFVFNYFLDQWNTAYRETGKGLTYGSCSTQLPQLKRGLTWLKEVDSIALQSSLKNLAVKLELDLGFRNKAFHIIST